MIVNFMCLGVEPTQEMQEAEALITGRFTNAFGGDYSFSHYGSEHDFMQAMSDAVEEADVIVSAVDAALFPAFKRYISGAFSMKLKKNKTLVKQFKNSGLNEATVEDQCIMPSDGVLLLTQDAINSGFAVKANRQILLVLPLDKERLPFLLDDSAFPYLRDHLDVSLFISNPLSGVEEKLPEKTAAPVAAAQQPTETLPISEAFVASVVAKLKKNGYTVAIANTKTVDFLRNVAAVVDMENEIMLSPLEVEKGNLSSENYAIKVAKVTHDKARVSLGATISKVYAKTLADGTKEYYIYACIADSKTANEAKVVAEPGDTPPVLVYRAIEVLFRMINAWADTGDTAIPAEAANTEEVSPSVLDDTVAAASDKKARAKIVLN